MSHNLDAIAEQLHQQGYRMTPQRQLILDAICAAAGHVTPEAIYEQVRGITPVLNRATVYRTLSFLAEQRILNVKQAEDGRLAYEIAGAEPHHHLICRVCGMEIEIAHQPIFELFQSIRRDQRFTVEMNHLTLYGLCEHCTTPPGPVDFVI
jgi:Fur family transcriptional regulator, ferric uptake regulator